MKRIRLYVRAFFGFSRMETNGFLILLPLVFLLIFSDSIYRQVRDVEPLTGLDRTDSLLAWMAERENARRNAQHDTIKFHNFDPNLITAEDLIALGLDKRIADRIVRYREKGGQFRFKEDLKKIYGMDSVWYHSASDWVAIAKNEKSTKMIVSKRQSTQREDINLADTLRLQDVYGIGPALARRIVIFRERLGGYIYMDQLREVYGLDSVVVERVKRQFHVKAGFVPRKINLEKATLDELNKHPYINRRQAQAIVAYRSQHDIKSVQQLRDLPQLGQQWLDKMMPYLHVASLLQ